jgi:uncharacterized DUF497 family protein
METEWDPAEARADLRKHRVRFADAVGALEDANAISIRDDGGTKSAGSASVWILSAVSLWWFIPGAASGCDEEGI